MNNLGKSMVSLVMIMFIIAFNAIETRCEDEFHQVHVKIQADIPGENIQAHCYAGDSGTDFGNKVLSYCQNFSFTFRTKPLGLTKYYCDFTTSHGSGNYGVFTRRVSDEWCGYDCNWYVTRDGPCVITISGKPQCQYWKGRSAAAVV